jgi:hypothetical protein
LEIASTPYGSVAARFGAALLHYVPFQRVRVRVKDMCSFDYFRTLALSHFRPFTEGQDKQVGP